jgi:hypothetical protein
VWRGSVDVLDDMQSSQSTTGHNLPVVDVL